MIVIGAQLVAGVGDELPLERERLVEPVEHRVEHVPELGDLVVAGELDPAREVVGGLDRARRGPQAPQRREHPPDGQ